MLVQAGGVFALREASDLSSVRLEMHFQEAGEILRRSEPVAVAAAQDLLGDLG